MNSAVADRNVPLSVSASSRWPALMRAQTACSYCDDAAFVKPAAAVVDEWLGELTAGGRDKQHRAQCRSHCRGILDKAGIVFLKDLTKDKIKAALAELEQERGWSPRTYNSWLIDFKTCMHFCMEKKYLPADPAQGIKKKEKIERRRVRRALKPAELTRLLASAFTSPKTIAGMTGPMRALLYTVAVLIGWRWSELRRIRRSEVYLNEEIPYIAPAAEKQKSRRSDIVVLRSDVMELLHAHFAMLPLPSDATASRCLPAMRAAK